MRPRMLWVTDEMPEPDLGGGSIRQYHLLRRISESVDVDLLLVGRLRNEELRRCLHQVIEISAGDRHWLPPWFIGRQAVLPRTPPSEVTAAWPVIAACRKALAGLGDYDLVQVEHEWLAPLVRSRSSGRWAITLHNLMSVRIRQQAALAEKPQVRWLLGRDAAHAARLERELIARYDVTLVVSPQDAAALGGMAPVVPNGVDLDKFRPTELPAEPRLLFTASWSWPPNVEAAQWLCRSVLPLVRAEIPAATVTLVGRSADPRLLELTEQPAVEAHFDVPSVVPFLADCRVAVVPVRVGSGTRLKALEAMAAGRPIAGTTIGLEGLGLIDGESAAVSDDPRELAARIVRLCRDDAHAARLAGAARALAEDHFGWDRIAHLHLDAVLGDDRAR